MLRHITNKIRNRVNREIWSRTHPDALGTRVGTGNESTRVAWLEQALKQVPSGARILDAGAGEQQFKKFCSHLHYVSQDIAQYDGEGDNKGLQTGNWDFGKLDIVSDITQIPEPDASFDALMCTEVLEHLPNPVLAIPEFSRLLKSGGQLILSAPFCSLTHFAPYHFCTGFNRYFYETHLRANGFTITELTPNGNYFEYLAQEVRRLPTMTENYAGRKATARQLLAMRRTLRLLQQCSQSDNGSQELLCYGIHVRAVKN